MAIKTQKYLTDIQTSIGSIYESIGDRRSFEVYMANKRRRRSVTHNLETVCEAIIGILQLKPDIPISNARKIVSLCNCVIHVHDSVDDEIVWNIIINYLPKLKEDVDRLLMNGKLKIK